MNKRNIIIIIGMLSFIVIVGGISYSYFVYNKDIGNVTLNTGDISISLTGINGNQTLTGVIPLSDNDGKTSSDYFDFTVNSTVDTEKIYYEVYIMPKSGNTLDTSYLKTYLTDQNDAVIHGIRSYDGLLLSENENGKVIYRDLVELNNNHTTKNESKDFRLRLWLDENYFEQTSKTFEFDIYVYAKNVDENFVLPYGSSVLKDAILAKQNAETNSCNPVFIDDMETANDETDDIIYFSGTNDCVDMNYVWYSGKLWRITAIYPDGTMKMITKNAISSVGYNAYNDIDFYTDANTKSYVYQWLNEDFYDTLYHPENVIDTSKTWDASNSNATSSADISNRLSGTTLVSANVGLLNSYEYFNSYRCADSNECDGANYSSWYGYLKTTYIMWLLNPYSSNQIWRVLYSGVADGTSPMLAYGLHPAIYLKSNVEFTGDGTESSPYKIVGDKSVGTVNQKINTRLSGEYIRLQSGNVHQDFRIVSVEDNKTKIVALDYADNGATKPYATLDNNPNTVWGNAASANSGTWYSYLNDSTTGYLATLKSTYGSGLFDSGVYYYGLNANYDYKLSICASGYTGTTKTCQKTSENMTLDIGLLRYGEMFTTQFAESSDTSIKVWLLNRYKPNELWYIQEGGRIYTTDYATDLYGVYPTLHLSSNVIILSGSGTESDPYVVGLPS